MSEILLMAAVAGSVVSILMLAALLLRGGASAEVHRVSGDLRALNQNQDRVLRSLYDELRSSRREALDAAAAQRSELSSRMKELGDGMLRTLENITSLQNEQLSNVVSGLSELTRNSDAKFVAINESLSRTQHAIGDLHKGQMESFSLQIQALVASNQKNFEELRDSVERRLDGIQADNERRLDQIRETVDEKLEGTLERRLGESFREVSARLDQVRQGLGEMHDLAGGVSDLKRIMNHVSARGAWAEVQLGRLLEDLLATDQYERDVTTRPGGESAVQFAVRLPGPGEGEATGESVWLPIEAAFHREEYELLSRSAESGDAEAVERAAGELEQCVRATAAELARLHICPPHTIDYAILFLPTEGLYAEVIRRPDLVESLQREHHVVVSGPTTLAALLSSLHLGFRTLAIQRRSSEVWDVLGAVKTEFEKFGGTMQRVQHKLLEASRVVEQAQARTRCVEHKLRDVKRLPDSEARGLLQARS